MIKKVNKSTQCKIIEPIDIKKIQLPKKHGRGSGQLERIIKNLGGRHF